MQLPKGFAVAFVLFEAAFAIPTARNDVQVIKRQQVATKFDTYVNCLNSAVAAVDTSCSQYELLETGQSVAYVKGLNLQNSTVKIDTVVQGTSTDRLIARLIVSATIPSTSGGAGTPVVFAKHVGAFFNEAGEFTEIHVQVDLNAIKTKATTYVDTSAYPNEPAVANLSMTSQFAGYMETMKSARFDELDLYFNEKVAEGGVDYDFVNFTAIIRTSRDAMPDLQLNAEWVVVDEEKQQLAAFVKFNGTLAKQWDVITWAVVGPSNETITFDEYALYWYENGKVRRVINTLDSPSFFDDEA